MDQYTLNQDQVSILNLASDFSKREILPHVKTYDQKACFPMPVFKKALEVGLLNMTIPECYGGLGFGTTELAITSYAFAKSCVGIGGAINLNALIADVLLIAGSDEQKDTYLKRLCSGQVASYALTEPDAGSDVSAIRTHAQKDGDDYIINGSKTWISNITEASFMIVFVKTNPEAKHKGISAFIIEQDTPGLTVGDKLGKLGQRAFPAAEIFFDNLRVSKKALLGKEGDGFLIAMKAFDRSRPMVASFAVGLIQNALDLSLSYATERKSFGKPIIKHQMVGAKIADMGMRLEAAKLLTHKAANLIDKGEPNTLAAAYAKTFASDTATWAASEAVQIFGGMGYSTEYPVEKLYRDAKVLQIYEGSNEIQRLIMARELENQQ